MAVAILIIDEDADSRIRTSAILRATGVSTLACATLQEALRAPPSLCPQLLVASAAALRDRGFARLRAKLRAAEPALRIVAIGTNSADARLDALTMGADCVLHRPVHSGLLQATARAHLRRSAEEATFRPARGELQYLGFSEEKPEPPLSADFLLVDGASDLPDALAQLTRARITGLAPQVSLKLPQDLSHIDVAILDRRGRAEDQAGLIRLLADFRGRTDARDLRLLIVFDPNAQEQAALALDMGADDVIAGATTPTEIAHRAGRLLRRKRAAEQFRNRVRDGLQAAVTDPLTGLANRRFALPKLIRMSTQHAALAVMLVDIDHFKSINDRYGHAMGDAMLTEFADRLRQRCGPEALIARLGGEEFLIARPCPASAEAADHAMLICDDIAHQPFRCVETSGSVSITASIGVTLVHGAMRPTDADRVLHAADQALYASKHGGRNRITLAEPAA